VAQQGYWFNDQYVALEPNDSLSFYVQIMDNQHQTVHNSVNIKKIIKCDQAIPVRQSSFIIKTTERPTRQDVYVSDIYHSAISDYIIILPSISFEVSDSGLASDIIKKYSNVISLKSIEGNVYRFKCHLSSSKEILELTSQILKEDKVKWCEPEKLSSWHTYNSKYPQQYYLKNTGQGGGLKGIDINVEPAWDLVSGSSDITVAVIDEGIDFDHEDMKNCVLSGYTVRNPIGYGAPQNVNDNSQKAHGVACAGIIGAEDNLIGIKGVASGVKLLPVNIVPDYGYKDFYGNVYEGFASDEEIAKAIVWASHRADVLSCSWGGGAYSQDIVNAIDSARLFGRNGKGCVVVFASGNGYHRGWENVGFPACINGVIAVGAIDNFGKAWNYSQRGSELDIVAPSGSGLSTSDIVTTDRMGVLGYNCFGDSNYYEHFGGTSAACPQVAGVAALMLSINPELTEQQVRSILKSTCRKLSGYTYDNQGWNYDTGHGLVDAYAAVCASIEISGSSSPFGLCTYCIKNLSNKVTVKWSFSGYSDLLTVNQPSNNQCTIDNSNYQYIKGTLVAKIYDSSNKLLTTLTKVIDTAPNFSASYTQTRLVTHEQTSGTIKAGQTINGWEGSPLSITSNDFVNGSFSFTSRLIFPLIPRHGENMSINSIPIEIEPTYSLTGNTLTVTHPSYFNPASIQTKVKCVNGKKIIEFSIYAQTLYEDSEGRELIAVISSEDNQTINVSLAPKDNNTEPTNVGIPQEWDIDIINAQTGKQVYNTHVTNNSALIKTSQWTKGIYVLKIKTSETNITKKYAY
jgi:subtilisin family serine protease